MDEKQFKLEKDIDRSTISRWRELTCGLSSSCRVLLGTTCRWKLSKLLEPCQDSACSCSRDRTRRCCTEGACCPAAAVASARSWTASWRRCGRCNWAMDSSNNWFWRRRRWMQSCTAKCRNRRRRRWCQRAYGTYDSARGWMQYQSLLELSSRQSTIFSQPVHASDGISPSAGARAD